MSPVATAHLRLVAPGFIPIAGLSAPDPRQPPRRPRPVRKPLGQILLDMKAVDPDNMKRALGLRERQDVRLGDILLAHGWVSDHDLMAALSLQWGARVIDPLADPPDPRLLDLFGAEFCLQEGILPWHQQGAVTVIATARPEGFARLRDRLPDELGDMIGPSVMALAPETAIHAALLAARQIALIRKAETRVAPAESCRTLNAALGGRLALGGLLLLAAVALISPVVALVPLFLWSVLTLILCMGLKGLTFASAVHAHFRPAPPPPTVIPQRLPILSLMVPLFHEDDIAPRLIRRLGRLDYPKELLDILLVVEEDDAKTRAALARQPLPRWMRVVTVPDGPIRTKPRALNYALNFCRGQIIGVYDAEDAPDPGQLRKVVQRFHECPPDVACLQGILDFYDARHNWLTRCFAVEYATWFRVILPGLARLGYIVPLGGTTLFFRRAVLEELGGWDAHNVTEDADLGVRLARHGYRTELIDSVTEEEPNARVLPWIRQRSRWQKGFAMTWAVHMRAPLTLLRQIGLKRFIGVQALFLGSLSQAILAPVLWTFWGLAFGLGHPLTGSLPHWAMNGLAALFVLSELLNIVVGLWAAHIAGHRHLMAFVPSMHLYFPLAAIASYKALWEAARRPFYWDKTRHGILDPGSAAAEGGAALPPLILRNPLPPPRPRLGPPLIWTSPAPESPPPLRLVARSDRVLTAGRSGIEFQPCFEGF